MNKKNEFFTEAFSENFIQFVNELRELDARSVNQPVYREKLDYVFAVMSERFLERLRARVENPDASGITLDRALTYYVNGESGDPILDYIVSRTRPLCEQMHIAPNVYGVVAYCVAVLMAKNMQREAYALFSIMMRPLVSAWRRRKILEKKKRGRPNHKHQGEAIDRAAAFRREAPDSSLYRVVQVVVGEMARMHADPPSIRAVESWLKERGYK
ncbi:hypothetical protein QUQ16_004361 [Escherichia coli]|nr:hypothetical protein [Escherichia coli]